MSLNILNFRTSLLLPLPLPCATGQFITQLPSGIFLGYIIKNRPIKNAIDLGNLLAEKAD
jgi:hypothetical protein